MNFVIDSYNALHQALHEMCAHFTLSKIPDEVIFRCKLVANELLANVLQHGESQAFFKAEIAGGQIVLSVKGENNFCPPEKSVLPCVEQERGRGLYLVDSYCVRREYSSERGIVAVLQFEI